ncbi:MAG TPA: DUF58 domain-containing protein, partial [Miltoncostaeaceae bacterium]|nr:DUF58 domain-containing protein [Miltoncostaeaceae bacterium]
MTAGARPAARAAVRPTARGVGLAAAGLAALVAARGFGTPALEPVGVGLLLVALVALVLVGVAATRVRLVRRLPAGRPRAGDEISAEIHRAGGRLGRLALRALEWQLDSGLAPLGPVRGRRGRGGAIRVTVPRARRGEHVLPPVQLALTDPFGLAVARRRFGAAQRLLVVPRTLPATAETRRLGEGARAARAPRGEDISRLDGVREYRPGDPLSRVHWGQSAKRGRLHTKVFGPEGDGRRVAVVVLDLADPGVAPHDAELAVVAAASLARAAAQAEGGRGSVTLWTGDLPAPLPCTWAEAEARLARAATGTGRGLAELLRRAPGALGTGTGVVAVTASAPPGLAEAARAARQAGLEVVVVLAGAAASAPASGAATAGTP